MAELNEQELNEVDGGAGRYWTYTVVAGDTLSEIGMRFGVPYLEIARLNNITNPDKIRVGQRLLMPGNGRVY